jgi:peptidoglycan-associated lipoprotein
MRNTKLVIGMVLLASMVAVSGCNKKNRKPEGATVTEETVSAQGTGVEYGPDGQPLGEWQGGSSISTADLLSQTRIYFAYDSSALDAEGQAIAEAHAGYLRDNPGIRVVLEGHTDERGTREYNLALGENRARTVADVLMAMGVEVSRIENVSYGEENPVAEGHDDSAWRLNRRVEIRYGN